jgi:hypothetical protein
MINTLLSAAVRPNAQRTGKGTTMTTRDVTSPTTAAELGRDVVMDAISDAPCAVAMYPIPEFTLRDPVGAAVDRFRLACWGTMLVLSTATIMTIVTVHWAIGTSAATALHRVRAIGRRAGAGRTAAAGAPLPLPAGTLARRKIYGARGVSWEPPLAETA